VNRQTDALRRFIGGALPAAAAPVRGHLVAIGAGKGGTGTSLVSALMALAAASTGVRTLLVDSDLEFGSLHRVFGAAPTRGLAALARGADAADVRLSLGDGLDLLPGGGADTGVTDLEHRTVLRRAAECYGDYDLVLVDAGSRLDAALRVVSAGAARLVVVAAPDPIAAAASYALLKAVHLRHPTVPLDVVMNRGDGGAARRAAEEVATACQVWLGRTVRCLADLPEDDSLRAALSAGLTLPDAASGSPVFDLLRTMAPALLQHHAGAGRPAVRSA
jgi:MinD-like ATPase involved in chromosome partitioning or flagellar assembly